MSRKVFMSCLGTGRYIPCRYQIAKEKTSSYVYFVQEALISLLCKNWEEQDKILIFCTQEAEKIHWQNSKTNNFKGLKECLAKLKLKTSVEKISIPTGKSEEELMAIFNIFFDRLNPKDQVILDITHAFRSIPLLAPLALNYAKIIKEIEVKGIYYGAFEVLGKEKAESLPPEECIAPIFDLTHYSQLFDWSRAVDIFLQSGEAKLISTLARQEIGKIFKNKKTQATEHTQKLSKFFNFLNNFSLNLFTVREANLRQTNFAPVKEIANIDYSPYKLPLAPLLKKLENKLASFLEKNAILPLEAAGWCIEHNLIPQAYIFILEGVITELCALHKQELKNENDRKFWSDLLKYITLPTDKQTSWKANPETKEKYTQEIKRGGESLKKLALAIHNLRDKRNDYMHAGWNYKATTRPERLISTIKEYYQEIKTALKEYKEYYLTSKEPTLSPSTEPALSVNQAPPPKKAFLVFSHKLTPDQIKDLQENWQVKEIVELPPELSALWKNIPPSSTNLENYLQPIINWLKTAMNPQDIVLIQGDFGASFLLVSFVQQQKGKAIYATTKRVVEEKTLSDGSVETNRIFKHVCFREYEQLNYKR